MLAKELNLPGFGDNVIEDMDGSMHSSIQRKTSLEVAANMAWLGKNQSLRRNRRYPNQWSGAYFTGYYTDFKTEEVRRIAYIFTRGGRFAPYEKRGMAMQQVLNGKRLTNLEPNGGR